MRLRLAAATLVATSAVALSLAPLGPTGAQPVAGRRVEGRLVVLRERGEVPLAGEWVTLHRVGSDSAGPLDSVRTDPAGGFAFRFRAFGADDALYFASSRYGGVAYFTNPLRGADVRGEDAEIAVYDTTSRPVPTTVRGRHLVVSAPGADGTRKVVEVFEISNDTSVTAVERPGGRGTWSTPLPARAMRPEVREGEVPADAVEFTGGRVVLRMPLAPGLKQVAVGYSLPADAVPLALRADRRVTVLEILVEDPLATAQGPRLTTVAPVVVEGRPFRRFLAQDVAEGAEFVIDAPRPQPGWVRWILPAVLGALGVGMLSALLAPRRRRGAGRARVGPIVSRPPVPTGRPVPTDAASIAREIAALDDAHHAGAGGAAHQDADASVAEYHRRRTELKRGLADALARENAAR